VDGPPAAGRGETRGTRRTPEGDQGAGRVALVVAAVTGGRPDPRIGPRLPAPDLVVAADSGIAAANALGLPVDLLVGDLDSAEPADVAAARDAGTLVEEHPAEKDQIDLELALDAACELGAKQIVVVAGAGGRLDMALANVAVLTRERYGSLEVEGWIGAGWLAVVRAPDRRLVAGRRGELVSLLPVGGAATVTTEGLRYPLRGEALLPGSSRGISNEVADPETASVQVEAGVVLVVRPEALEAGT
jgi:thiamine pyrophosphokinase